MSFLEKLLDDDAKRCSAKGSLAPFLYLCAEAPRTCCFRTGDPWWTQNENGQRYIMEVGIAVVQAFLDSVSKYTHAERFIDRLFLTSSVHVAKAPSIGRWEPASQSCRMEWEYPDYLAWVWSVGMAVLGYGWRVPPPNALRLRDMYPFFFSFQFVDGCSVNPSLSRIDVHAGCQKCRCGSRLIFLSITAALA